MKKTTKKVLALVSSAVLLVSASVLGTMAYLTSQDVVTNTFSVGKVTITLDEADVKTDGTKEDTTDRVKSNEYHLMPGHDYIKDPTVHVAANSENSWIFIKVENGIANIEDGSNPIATQISNKGWTALDGVNGVYYKEYTKSETQTDLIVFEKFVVNETVNGTTLETYKDAQIKVTAYAIQKDGIDSVSAAWSALNPTTTE